MPSRRSFLKACALTVGGLALYSGEIERHWIDVREVTVRIAKLPEAFRGFRIVQIADIHYGEFTEPTFLRAAIAKANALKPDLVALTGDFVSSGPMVERISVDFGYHCADLLAKLTCPLRYAVLGNHDVMVNAAAVTDALRSQNIPVLHNAYVPLEREGARIWLAGTADQLIDSQADLSLAVPKDKVREGLPVVLMAHEPDFADEVTKWPVDLMLSGHTHGGQVRIPFLPPLDLPNLGRKYVEGLFTINRLQLYVNRGLGTVGAPVRFLCPPEITVITLA